MIPLTAMLVLLALFALSAEAQANQSTAAIQRLQAFIGGLQSLEAEFTQRTTEIDSHQMPQVSRGRFSAKRPGRFRWDYREPFEQLIVSDGQAVFYYEVDLEQVTKTRADILDETPAAFFVSNKPLSQTFNFMVDTDPVWKQPRVRLIPKKNDGTIQHILLTLHPQKNEILNLVILDALGNQSQFTFLKIVYNGPMRDDRFRFVLPQGVDLIDESRSRGR